MSDEETIKRRLLLDGDGMGDDRRLNAFLKLVVKWVNYPDASEQESQLIYDRHLASLSQCEFAVKRAKLLQRTHQLQLEKYQNLHVELESQIRDVKESIEESKKNLAQAKILKQNQMMYDLLAQNIKQLPARKQTTQLIEELEGELGKLKEEKKVVEQKLEMQCKQFYVLVSSANQLRTMLEEASEDEVLNSSLDDIVNNTGAEPMSE